jgi:hypothetical protein
VRPRRVQGGGRGALELGARDGRCPPTRRDGGAAPSGAASVSTASTTHFAVVEVHLPDGPAATATSATGTSYVSGLAMAGATRAPVPKVIYLVASRPVDAASSTSPRQVIGGGDITTDEWRVSAHSLARVLFFYPAM